INSRRAGLIKALVEVVGKMESGNAEKDIGTLTRLINDIREAPQELLDRLNKAAGRMEPEKAIAVLTDLMDKNKEYVALFFALSETQSEVAKRLEPGKSVVLLELMAKASEPSILAMHARSLAVVAGRMEPSKANQVCSKGADILFDAMSKHMFPSI